MKLRSVRIDEFRAIGSLTLPLDPELTVLHGNNGHGKTSVLAAIAVGLGIIPTLLARGGGISFRKSDARFGREARTRVHLEVLGEQGLWWRLRYVRQGHSIASNIKDLTGLPNLKAHFAKLAEDVEASPATPIPVFAFYDTDRAVFDIPERKRDFRKEFNRFDAYTDALARKTSFKSLVEWFYESENIELRLQRERGSFDYRLPALNAVRQAIVSMMADVDNPHIEPPARFVVERQNPAGQKEKLSLEQLSGGYRIVLALAADLARRMALANPHLSDPLRSEAIVMIDEVDLHLHPEWQQRILGDLRRTFPNTQFIVSTHSPQVLSTVEPSHIVHLRTEDDNIVAEQETGPTFGAKAGDVLTAVMGVEQRPDNEFRQRLDQYQTLIAQDRGASDEAAALRTRLEALSPHDPALGAADVEIGRRRLMRELAARR